MQFKILLSVLVAAATPIAAVGNAIVVNNCPEDFTVYSVGNVAVRVATLGAKTDPSPSKPGGVYSEPFTRDPFVGGRAIKLTRGADDLSKPHLVFAYTLDPGAIWYDMSTVFGDLFSGRKLSIRSAQPDCPSIVWDSGISPGGSQVKVCTPDKDLTLTLCAP